MFYRRISKELLETSISYTEQLRTITNWIYLAFRTYPPVTDLYVSKLIKQYSLISYRKYPPEVWKETSALRVVWKWAFINWQQVQSRAVGSFAGHLYSAAWCGRKTVEHQEIRQQEKKENPSELWKIALFKSNMKLKACCLSYDHNESKLILSTCLMVVLMNADKINSSFKCITTLLRSNLIKSNMLSK